MKKRRLISYLVKKLKKVKLNMHARHYKYPFVRKIYT